MPSQRTLDLLTVVYAPELDMLRTQARSIANRFGYNDLAVIHVIVNDDPSLADQIDVGWWHQHEQKVKIYTRADMGYSPSHYINGWHSQQILKLLGAANSTSDWCMILDAKTWFVRNYEESMLFDNGRARMSVMAVTPPPFLKGKQYLEELLGVEYSVSIGPGGVPYLMKPAIVCRMLEVMQDFTGKPFIEWFESNCHFPINGVTEFVCYAVFVHYLFGSIDAFYTGEQDITVHNLADWEVGRFDHWYSGIQSPSTFTASIQGKALPLLNQDQITMWNRYLNQRDLA